MQTLFALFVLLASWLAPTAHAADGEAPTVDCSNPAAAADNLFVWQRPESFDTTKAAACMSIPEGVRGATLAVQLRQVLDARALYVPVDSLPTDPDFKNEDGDSIVEVLPDDAPWLVLRRDDQGAWKYSRRTVERIPGLYDTTFSPLSRWLQSALPEVFHTPILGLQIWQYLYAVLLVLAAYLAALLVRVVLVRQARRLASRASLRVDSQIFNRVNLPLTLLAVGAVLLWGVADLQLSVDLSATLYVALTVFIGLGVILLISRVVDIGAGIWSSYADKTESRLDDQLIPLAHQATRVLVWVLGVIFVLQNAGVEVWSFVAGLGIGTLAFALAAQDSVANLFGALNIFLDKPFQIGDSVKIGGVEGAVEEVGFRSIRIRTFYNSLVTIPNSTITNTNVDNLGVRPRRRVKLTLGLTYDTPPEKVQAYVEGIRAILNAHPAVQRTYEVHFYNLGDSALEILVYYHLVVPSWTDELESRAQNLLEFMRLAQQLEVSFAFPSTSVYVESTPDKPLQPQPHRELDELEATYSAFGPEGRLARPGGVPFARGYSIPARTQRGEIGRHE